MNCDFLLIQSYPGCRGRCTIDLHHCINNVLMRYLTRIPIYQTKAIVAIVSIIPCDRHQFVLFCIITYFLIIIGSTCLILRIIVCFVDGSKLADDNAISLRHEFIIHFLKLRSHITFITPSRYFGLVCCFAAPLRFVG